MGNYVKVTQILEGAETRNETTAAALAALGDEECNVLLHDAARPLVSQTIITANIEALQTHKAVDTAIPSADTIIQVQHNQNSIADVLLKASATSRSDTTVLPLVDDPGCVRQGCARSQLHRD